MMVLIFGGVLIVRLGVPRCSADTIIIKMPRGDVLCIFWFHSPLNELLYIIRNKSKKYSEIYGQRLKTDQEGYTLKRVERDYILKDDISCIAYILLLLSYIIK